LLSINDKPPQKGDVYYSSNFTIRVNDWSVNRPAEWVIYSLNQKYGTLPLPLPLLLHHTLNNMLMFRVRLTILSIAKDQDPTKFELVPDNPDYVVLRLAYRDRNKATLFDSVKGK
jgi:hypothetical protein